MNAELYWFPFRIQEEGCVFVVFGPYSSHEEAMKHREIQKMKSTIKEYVGVPFVAKDKEEAEERAHLY